MKTISGLLIGATATIAGMCASSASAQTLLSVSGVPSAWILQNYVPNQVWLYYTGAPSPCVNGGLSFPSTAVQADQDRLWAMIIAAKIAAQPVIVYYTVSGSSCFISSYVLNAT